MDLRFTRRALRRLQKEHGIDFLGGGKVDMDGPQVLDLLMWAGMLHERPDLTPEQAEEIADEYTPAQLVDAVMTAIRRDLTVTSDKPEAAPTAGGSPKSDQE